MVKEKRTYSDRRQYLIEAVRKRRKKVRQMAVAYKGYRCERCGYDDCIEALDFHHKDPSKKDFGISSKGYTRSWSKIRSEVDKCVMLCANCHREVHSKLAAPGGNAGMTSRLNQGNPGTFVAGSSGRSVKLLSKQSSPNDRKGNPELALTLDEIFERECRDFTPAALPRRSFWRAGKEKVRLSG